VTSFAGGDLGYSSPPCPPSPEVSRARISPLFPNLNKSFSLGNYYRAEEPKVKIF
jgi:hypothetical protein